MFESRFQLLRSFAARHAIKLVLALILAYFGYHSVHGERGLFAWIDHSRALEAKRAELVDMQRTRERLESRVEALGKDNLNRDLLEEELYKLGYVKRDELVVLTPQDRP